MSLSTYFIFSLNWAVSSSLARAPALQAGGERFESVTVHDFFTPYWQSGRLRLTVDQDPLGLGGSNPSCGSIFF